MLLVSDIVSFDGLLLNPALEAQCASTLVCFTSSLEQGMLVEREEVALDVALALLRFGSKGFFVVVFSANHANDGLAAELELLESRNLVYLAALFECGRSRMKNVLSFGSNRTSLAVRVGDPLRSFVDFSAGIEQADIEMRCLKQAEVQEAVGIGSERGAWRARA